jgi:hypothetical protein
MMLRCQSTSALAEFYEASSPKHLVLQLNLSVTLGVARRTATYSEWYDLHVICLSRSVLTPCPGYLPLANRRPHHRPGVFLRRHLTFASAVLFVSTPRRSLGSTLSGIPGPLCPATWFP